MKPDKNNEINTHFLFEKVNYKWLLIGLAVIALGFILMSGGGSDDPNVWNPEVFNFQRIRLAPTVVLIGFGITIYSIIKNPSNVVAEEQPDNKAAKQQTESKLITPNKK